MSAIVPRATDSTRGSGPLAAIGGRLFCCWVSCSVPSCARRRRWGLLLVLVVGVRVLEFGCAGVGLVCFVGPTEVSQE